ncbi:hypothetical protein ACFL67_02360 [candidate division KSB1 bacterium]
MEIFTMIGKKTKFRLSAVILLYATAFILQCSQPAGPTNSAPLVLSMTPTKRLVNFQERITIKADVKDADGDSISYLWSSSRGNFTSTSLDSAVWNAPDTAGGISIRLHVSDISGGGDTDSTVISVKNQFPVINSLTATETNVVVGNMITLRVSATDPDGSLLRYEWIANAGEFIGAVNQDSIKWRASTDVEEVTIRATVYDNIGDYARQDIVVSVFKEVGSVWIADTFNDRIIKMASNGTQLKKIEGFNKPQSIAIDLNDRSIWVADRSNDRLVKLDSDGKTMLTVTGLDRPTGLAMEANGNIWVTTMSDSNQVVRISHNGTILKSVNGFSDPQAIAVNMLNNDIWVADTGNDQIVLLDRTVPNSYNISKENTVRFDTPFSGYTNPEALSVNQITGDCWIADTGNHRVVRISGDNQSEFIINGFRNPRGISINIVDGSCWIANTGDNEVIKIFSNIFGLPQDLTYNIDKDAGFHDTIKGYMLPWGISVHSNEKVVWFSDNFRVVKVQDDGNSISVLKEYVNFNAPKSIVVNPGINP